ncbi:MAG: hypothetical protein HGB01_04415 [Chlorobiaceae bacterium]|nr:hypothetical protein [Chlorobiaceae bacterium]NTV25436.1 hypothetical protein [Chlorobiaceae bacterium]
MKTNHFISEDITSILRDIETEMQSFDHQRLQEMEDENKRLKQLVDSQDLEIRMLREMTIANW